MGSASASGHGESGDHGQLLFAERLFDRAEVFGKDVYIGFPERPRSLMIKKKGAVSNRARSGGVKGFCLPDYLTTCWTEFRSVRFFFERGTRRARLIAVLDDSRDGEVVDAEIRVARKILRQDGIVAIARPARQQVAALHVGRNDVEAAPSRSRRLSATSEPATTAASTTAASTADFPCTHGITLQRFLSRRGWRSIEVDQP